MSCTIDVVAWMKDVLQEIINKDAGKGYMRKFSNSSMTLVAEILVNHGGEHLRFMKIQDGMVRNIVLPGERFKKSWVIMKDRLGIILGTQPRDMPVQRDMPARSKEASGNGIGKTFRDILLMRGQDARKEGRFGGVQEVRKDDHEARMEGQEARKDGHDEREGVLGEAKSWKLAVVVYRKSTYWSWNFIETELQSRLGRAVEVVPMAADRAAVWCTDEQEKKGLLAEGAIFCRKATVAKLETWNMYSHWNHTQIEAKDSWIGIKGLPLIIWNYQVLKNIGDCCGGLLEIANETINQTFLLYVKIKVKGFKDGFLSPIIEIHAKERRFTLGFSTSTRVILSQNLSVGLQAYSGGVWVRRRSRSHP